LSSCEFMKAGWQTNPQPSLLKRLRLQSRSENMGHILQCHQITKTDFARGQGCHLYDEHGKEYIDFESGCWSTALGHSHPRINQVMEAQIKQVTHLGTYYPNRLAEDAATAVLEIAGIGDGKCIFLSSGSEAVEFAVQATRRITGKQLLLTFSNSYLAAYGSAGRKSSDEWYLLDWNSRPEAELPGRLDEIPFDRIGAFVFEPGGSGSAFVRFPPKQLVLEITKRVKQAGGLLIANEITTGMGRTGKWFGFQHYDFQPDIVSIGKGLGNGYPVSAIAIQMELAEKLENCGFHYVQSHQNDPLGCAIAREVIAVFREEDWVEKGNAVGMYFLEGLKRLEGKYPIVKEARGRGMLLGLEFRPHDGFLAETAHLALLEKGFLAGYSPAGNLLRFDPALIITKDKIDLLLESLDHILKEV
jgi:acetylornithine/N-succinyldiaminopimelate aminotransferase